MLMPDRRTVLAAYTRSACERMSGASATIDGKTVSLRVAAGFLPGNVPDACILLGVGESVLIRLPAPAPAGTLPNATLRSGSLCRVRPKPILRPPRGGALEAGSPLPGRSVVTASKCHRNQSQTPRESDQEARTEREMGQVRQPEESQRNQQQRIEGYMAARPFPAATGIEGTGEQHAAVDDERDHADNGAALVPKNTPTARSFCQRVGERATKSLNAREVPLVTRIDLRCASEDYSRQRPGEP